MRSGADRNRTVNIKNKYGEFTYKGNSLSNSGIHNLLWNKLK